MNENKQFDYKGIDKEGMETLMTIAKADKFNAWMYESIQPHCSGEILEIGSGIGNISYFFLSNGANITLSDLRENYFDVLKNNFNSYPNLKGIMILDLVDGEFDVRFGHLFNTFDTIFALNVVEHIEDDNQAIINCKKMLKKGGKLVILVPAYNFLYNRFDKELGHYRRYTLTALKKKFVNTGFEVKAGRYFNFIGIFGWFVSGKIMKNKVIPSQQMSLFNKLVPVFKFADSLLFKKSGLSVIVVGVK